jgi:hypothetical protein
MALDEDEAEYSWHEIYVCDALSVSLFIEEEGETSYLVTYPEDDQEIEK